MRLRLWSVLLLLALAAASCSTSVEAVASDGGDEILDSRPLGEVVETTPPTETPAPDDTPDPNGTAEPRPDGVEPYLYRVAATGDIDGTARTLRMEGGFDPETGDGMWSMPLADFLFEIGVDDGQFRGGEALVESVQIDGEWFSRGLVPEVGIEGATDVDVWYRTPIFGDDSADLLRELGTFDLLQQELAPLDPEPASALDGEAAAMAFSLTEEDVDQFSDRSLLGLFSSSGAVSAVIAADDAGRITRLEGSYERKDTLINMFVEIYDYGRELAMPLVVAPQSLTDIAPPAVGGEAAPSPAADYVGKLRIGDVRLESLPTLRISSYLGNRTSDAEDTTFVIEPDGDVLRIDSGDIFTGPSGYTTWNIGPDGYEEIVDNIRRLGMFDSEADPVADQSGPAGSIWAGNQILFNAYGLTLGPDELTSEQLEVRQLFLSLLAELGDTSGVSETARPEPIPWVPSHLSISIREDVDDRYYTTDDFSWPFEHAIAAMVDHEINGERFVCLEGTQARIAWEHFLVDDVNNARLPIDDGSRHEAGLLVSYPTYRRGTDPCPSVTELGGN